MDKYGSITTMSFLFSPAKIFYFFYILFVIITIVRLLLDNKSPEATVGWFLALFFLPFLGVVLYLLGGVNWKKKKILKHLPEKRFNNELGPILERQKAFTRSLTKEIDTDVLKTMTLSLQSGNSVLTINNDVRLFYNGEQKFSSLLKDLEDARESIHMEYFIYKEDETGKKIAEILKRKVQEGVEVRIIFDGVGCFNRMSWKFKRNFVKAGVETKYFLDPMNVISGRLLNYCNHRKIVVIDGSIGYTGGMNIGDEYITGGIRFDSWRDTHMRLEGEVVHMLQTVFLSDWENSGGTPLHDRKYFPRLTATYNRIVPMQVLVSGPDSDWYSLEKLYFNMISNADREVYIQSPYFIPSSSIQNAMETAALSGVRINLMITGIPDKRIPFWVAQTYMSTLFAAGVHIYLYEKGFLHAKTVIVDDKMATVGTCNMDIRSFHLDYEVNVIYYDDNITKNLKDQFFIDLKQCRQLTEKDMEKQSMITRLRNSLFRIIAPIL